MPIKLTKRKGFNFFRSYYDVYNELESKEDKIAFIEALLDRQFLGIKPENLNGMAKFAYISQTNSIDAQVKGYEDKTGVKLTPTVGGSERVEIPPAKQVEVEEEEQVEEKDIVDLGDKPPKLPKTNLELLNIRKEKFYKDVGLFAKEYSKELLRAFYDYWTEPNKSNSKMRWELEKTFSLSLRLKNWSKNEKGFANKNPKNTGLGI